MSGSRACRTSCAVEEISDPGEAFETILRGYLEAAGGDAGFQLAMLGSNGLQ
jgi:hypothetical protein